MAVTGHLEGAPGELVAVDLPPGAHWLDVLADLWARGVSVLPLDHRLAERERSAIVELARPALVVTPDGATVFGQSAPADPDRAAVVVATSGTGGTPRLAELPRVAVAAAIERSNAALGATPEDPWVAVLPPGHVGGLLVYLRHAVARTPVEAHPRFEPATLVGRGPVFASVVPTMVRRLVDARADLAGVTLLVGGDHVDPGLRDAAAGLGARVVGSYGLTEACGGVAYDGALLDGTRARVAADGTVELSGPTLMEGYRRDAQATAGAFTLDGWLRTEDVGELDRDGRLVVHGRADELITTGGEKVWPEEIERALADHPKVSEVAAAGLPDAEWGQRVAVWVVPRRLDDPPTLEELSRHARGRLARYKLPRELHLLVEVPKTASGKVRRSVLAGRTPGPGRRHPTSLGGEPRHPP
jgi:O-succinylbenzoic acid--CoA ligase